MAFITRHRSKAMRDSKRAIIVIMMYDGMITMNVMDIRLKEAIEQ